MKDVPVLLFLCFALEGYGLLGAAVVQGNYTLGNLTCIYCEETFQHDWEPNTNCQSFPQREPVRQCSVQDKYCRVQRTSAKGMTIQIIRECAKECLYGCKVSGFAFTKLICTSCCTGYACNTDNGSSATYSKTIVTDWIMILFILVAFHYPQQLLVLV